VTVSTSRSIARTFPSQVQDFLKRRSAWLAANPDVHIVLEGHADERGTREYNLALAQRRADAVMDYLSAPGIDRSRLAAISFGKERPAMPGATEEAWSNNRHAVTGIE